MLGIILFISIIVIIVCIGKLQEDFDNKNPKITVENKSNDSVDIENIQDSLNVPDEQPIDKNYEEKTYKIAGVLYKNEENKEIQKELKKILSEYIDEEIITLDDMYLGYSTEEIKRDELEVSQYEDITFEAKLEQSIFEDEPCIKVYILRADEETYTHVGYIPKKNNQIQEVINILKTKEDVIYNLTVVGGKIRKGISDYNVYTDKEKYYIENTTLDYGLRLHLK